MPQPEVWSGRVLSTGTARGRRVVGRTTPFTDEADCGGGVDVPGVEGGVKDGLRSEGGGGCMLSSSWSSSWSRGGCEVGAGCWPGRPGSDDTSREGVESDSS